MNIFALRNKTIERVIMNMNSFDRYNKIYREQFKSIFPDTKINIDEINPCWDGGFELHLIKFTFCYIAKEFDDNVFKLFDYKDILDTNKFDKEFDKSVLDDSDNIIWTLTEEEMRNPAPLTEKYIKIIPDVVNEIYRVIKDYIFEWINAHEKDIKANAILEKVNAEIVNIKFSKEKLYGYYKVALDKTCPHRNIGYHEYLNHIMIGVQSFHNGMELDGEQFDADYIITYPIRVYEIQLLSEISEKLYYYILSEVKNILTGDIDSELKPSESLEIPQQQAVDWDNAFAPVDVKQIIPQFPYDIDIFQIIQQAQEEFAASVEVNPDLIKLYDTFDTYNKTVVRSFMQIILKNKNSISQ